MSGVLVFHNILWSHYKGRVFSELYKLCAERSIEFNVVQYAMTEHQRSAMGAVDKQLHQYPYRLMSEGSYDDLGLWTKIGVGFEELRSKDPEVVVLPGYWDPSHWVLLTLARLQGRSTIISVDSTEYDHPRYWLKEQAKRLFVRQCGGAFTYGQRSKRYLKQLGMEEDRITIRCQATVNDEIRRGYEITRPSRNQLIAELKLGNHNFCYVGRLSQEKNVSVIVRALTRLRRLNPKAQDWGMLVVGDGPERAPLEGLFRREGLGPVAFVGGVSWRDVPRFLAAADVLVLPSLSEPWGLVVNEAMICGLPVLVSDRCGCVEDLVYGGQTGFAFDPRSAEELCENMDYFVRFPGEIETFGERARQIISAYTPESAAQQMLKGIQHLLGGIRREIAV